MTGWLSGWQYRKSHVINSASGAGTGYQVQIFVNYGSGTDSGNTVYLNSRCKTDFSDVRFTSSDGTTLLSYWIESYTASSSAIFWVKLTDDISSTSSTIYIYYGNSGATSASSGADTFLLFDHFDGSSIDTTKWTANGSATTSVSNSILSITIPTGTTTGSYWIRSNSSVSFNVAIEARVQASGGSGINSMMPGYTTATIGSPSVDLTFGSKFNGVYLSSGQNSTASWALFVVYNSNTSYNANRNIYSTYNTWLKTKIALTQTYQQAYIYDDSRSLLASSSALSNTLDSGTYYVGLGATWNTTKSQRFQFDWVFVRKFVNPEPTHGSWGSEEIASTPVNTTDSGSGTDSLTSLVVLISISDSGSGVESIVITASISVGESGASSDSLSSLAGSYTSADTGLGSENILNTLRFSDSGSGVDTLSSLTASNTISDAGAGTDSLGLSNIATDGGSGVDSLSSLTVSYTVSDSGRGTDSLSLSVVIGESGSGADSLSSLTGNLTPTDTAHGVDSLFSLSILVIDGGTGTESVNINVRVSISDSSSGTDSLTSLSVAVSETGSGADSLFNVIMAISDSGIGADTISLNVSISLSDLGSGVDSLSNLSIKISDSGSGADSLTNLTASILLSETGSGSDILNYIRLSSADSGTGVEVIGTANTLLFTDSGIGVDTLSSISASISLAESGKGTDTLSSLTASMSIADSGHGNETLTFLSSISIIESGKGVDVFGISLSVLDMGSEVESVSGGTVPKPYIYNARVTITDVNGVERQVYPMNLNLKISGEMASEFDMTLPDLDGSLSSWVVEGLIVKVYISFKDANRQPFGIEQPKFLGQIEEVEPQIPTPSERYLRLRGRDRFSIDIVNRVVTESYTNIEISDIVKDLISKYVPDVDTSTYVQDTGITLDKVIFSYRNLKDCLDTLATVANFTYYCGPDLKLHWEPKKIEDTGLTLADSTDIFSPPTITRSIMPVKNVVYVIGGTYEQENQTIGVNPTSYVSLDSNYYARPFVANRSDISQISLYLGKVGNPSNLEGVIKDDNNGVPGRNIASFSYDSDYVGSAGWYPIKATATLVAGDTYWIVLKKNGDANNTYRWYYASSSSDSYSYSADGTTWTRVNNTNSFSLKTYYEVPVVVRVEDNISAQRYRIREYVITDSNIKDIDTAKALATAMLNQMKDVFVQLDELAGGNVYPIPEAGQLLGIYVPRLNLNDRFEIKELQLEFKGGVEISNIKLRLGDTVTKLHMYLSDLKKTLDLSRVGKLAEGMLNLYRNLADSVGVSDTCNTNIQTAGTFKVDYAKVGFSDVG